MIKMLHLQATVLLFFFLLGSFVENHKLSDKNIIILNENNALRESVIASENMVEHLMEKLFIKPSYNVKVTGYHPDSGGTNSDSNPSMTATMTPHKAGRTCAISTELVKAGWLGKEIYIEGYGMMIANDRLAVGIKGYQIDLCKGSYNDAMKVGENFDVLATLTDRKFIKQKLEEN